MGRRRAAAGATREAILAAGRELVAAGLPPTIQEIAHRAGVSRVTVYNRLGSRAEVIAALAPPEPPRSPGGTAVSGGASARLRQRVEASCARWSRHPALYRHLPAEGLPESSEQDRELAEGLAAEDALRPGCSIREAQDVIAILCSFAAFDRLHQDGRRTAGAVADILVRLGAGILAS